MYKKSVDEFIVSYDSVQKHTDGYNCGFLVFAAKVLDGKSWKEDHFNVTKMRGYLILGLVNERVSLFPKVCLFPREKLFFNELCELCFWWTVFFMIVLIKCFFWTQHLLLDFFVLFYLYITQSLFKFSSFSFFSSSEQIYLPYFNCDLTNIMNK